MFQNVKKSDLFLGITIESFITKPDIFYRANITFSHSVDTIV